MPALQPGAAVDPPPHASGHGASEGAADPLEDTPEAARRAREQGRGALRREVEPLPVRRKVRRDLVNLAQVELRCVRAQAEALKARARHDRHRQGGPGADPLQAQAAPCPRDPQGRRRGRAPTAEPEGQLSAQPEAKADASGLDQDPPLEAGFAPLGGPAGEGPQARRQVQVEVAVAVSPKDDKPVHRAGRLARAPRAHGGEGVDQPQRALLEPRPGAAPPDPIGQAAEEQAADQERPPGRAGALVPAPEQVVQRRHEEEEPAQEEVDPARADLLADLLEELEERALLEDVHPRPTPGVEGREEEGPLHERAVRRVRAQGRVPDRRQEEADPPPPQGPRDQEGRPALGLERDEGVLAQAACQVAPRPAQRGSARYGLGGGRLGAEGPRQEGQEGVAPV